METEQPLEAQSVIPAQSGPWTVVALDCDTGSLYGIAAEPRAAHEIAQALTEPWELPPQIWAEPWQILWAQHREPAH